MLLPPIPEAPDSADPEGERISARFAPVIEHSDLELSSAETEMQGQGESIAVERQVTPRYRVTAWPAHREVRGELTLRGSANHPRAVRAVCSVQHGVLTLSCATSSTQRAARGLSSAGGESGVTVVAEVPVEDLAVGLQQRGRVDMFMLATLHRNRTYDHIFCFVDDQVKRNKWIAVFRRMGISIFHMQDGSNAGIASATEVLPLRDPEHASR
jgi:hypothetical protein